jgi:hypothetical protein
VVRAVAALLMALALAAAPAIAATYKWTDANGRVIYSDQPPPPNVKAESLAPPPPPANPNAAKDLATKEAEIRQQKKKAAEEEQKSAKARVEANQKQQQCARARSQLLALQSSDNVALYRPNEKGEQVYMDQAAKLREAEVISSFIRQNCQG